MAYEGKRSAGTGKRGKLVLIFGAVFLLILAAALIWFAAANGGAPKKVENTVQEVVAEDDVLQTPYGELSFPGIWTDKVSHETVEDGADLRIVFSSTLKDAEVELFTLCYGAVPEEGYVMGQMADGTEVSVVMSTIEPDAAWSEETLNSLYSLQESVNDLLIQLQSHPDFTPRG